MRDAQGLDGLQGLLSVESLHHGHGAAERLDGTAPAQRRRVIDRAGRQVDRVVIDAEELAGQGHQGLAWLGHLDAGQRRPDSLGPAGGARGVQHGGAPRLIGERHRRRRGDGLLVAAVVLNRAAEGQPQLHSGSQAGDRLGGGGQLGRHHQRGRAAIADDVGHLVRLEPVVDGGDVQSGPQRGPVHLEGTQVVLGQQRHHVAWPQARLVQYVRKLDRTALEVPVAERLAGAGHDRRDPVRRLGRVRSWVHGPPPGRLVAVGPLKSLINLASKYPGCSAVGKHAFGLTAEGNGRSRWQAGATRDGNPKTDNSSRRLPAGNSPVAPRPGGTAYAGPA